MATKPKFVFLNFQGGLNSPRWLYANIYYSSNCGENWMLESWYSQILKEWLVLHSQA